MAEDLERWRERTPEPNDLFNRLPAFGPARDAERICDIAPALPIEVQPRKPRRERGPFITCLCMPWSYGDRGDRDFWHRIRCRVGRHEIAGGHPMQVAGTTIFVERGCRWCGVEPGR